MNQDGRLEGGEVGEKQPEPRREAVGGGKDAPQAKPRVQKPQRGLMDRLNHRSTVSKRLRAKTGSRPITKKEKKGAVFGRASH